MKELREIDCLKTSMKFECCCDNKNDKPCKRKVMYLAWSNKDGVWLPFCKFHQFLFRMG